MKKITATIFLLASILSLRSQYCDSSQFEAPLIYDTYHEYYDQPSNWACYNVHDPTVCKDGDWYYMYNTDVGMGYNSGTGALKRRSTDLVNWEFRGQAFDGLPDSARSFFLQYNPGYTDNGIWAPFLMKYKDGFRLYYSAPGGLDGVPLAFIGWAVSASADGPWEDQGKITASVPGDTINAIDPTVVIDRVTGQHWMAYGSYETGIYIVELDSTTGGLKTEGDRGVRLAGRSGGRHRAIEGPEITYRDGWYYLFVSYDWLEDYYNVRVGRSENPAGPYYDINGLNMADYSNNYPAILKPYRFNDHEGWQGTGHCGVYDDEGEYYMFHQARPGTDIYNMVLHTRKIYWIDDWPVLSPERYVAMPQCSVTADLLFGEWEHMELDFTLGLMRSPSATIEFSSDGTIDDNTANIWSLQDSMLTLSWNNGESIQKAIVSRGWDWENSCRTILYTGMDPEGLNVWGKKIDRDASEVYTKLVSGAAYQIRSHYSNMLIEVPEGNDGDGITIRQGRDNGEEYQFWRLAQYPDGYWKMVALHSESHRVIEVSGTSFLTINTFTGEDNQKFKIEYKGDGYFKILTKVSDEAECFDLYNFSVEEGGFIAHWADLDGVNQAWRFKRIDSLGIDNSVGLPGDELSGISVYPNPFSNELYIETQNAGDISRAELYNPLGQLLLVAGKDQIAGGKIVVPSSVSGHIFILKIYLPGGYISQKITRY